MTSRPRHYVSPLILTVLQPVLRYSYSREAYVMRAVGETRGPVLRENLRRRQREFEGPDRRRELVAQNHGAMVS